MSFLRNQQFLRVSSSYMRMALGFVAGILLIRVLLRYGDGVFAAFALTASSIGVAEILKESIRGATIPELGISYHSGDRNRFQSSFDSSLLLSLIAGIFGVAVLGLFIVFLDRFDIMFGLEAATAIFIATRMVSVFVAITLSPVINLLPITGRMVPYNGWLAMERVAELTALVVATLFVGPGDGAGLLVAFGYLSMLTVCSVTIASAIHAAWGSDLARPNWSQLSHARLRQVFSSIGWNGAAVASVNLYLRFDVFAVNIFFGVAGTVIFGVASQLAAYSKQVTMGLITGLDSVVSKKAAQSSGSSRGEILQINQLTFKLQCISLFAVGVVLLLHADVVLRFLFGDQLSDPIVQIPIIAQSFVFLMVGMISRGLSEGWMSVLAGSGRIRDYALPVLLGALLNPVLVVLAAKFFAPSMGLLSVSVIFMLLNIIFHLIAVPAVTARFLEIGFFDFLAPAIGPLLVAVVCGALSVLGGSLLETDFHRFILTCIVTGLVFVPWFISEFRTFMKLR